MEKAIEFKGLNKLEKDLQEEIKKITAKHYKKIGALLKEIQSFKVHVKQHEKSGHASRYTLITQIISKKDKFELERTEYNLTLLMNKSFEALKNDIEHKLSSKYS